MQQAVSNRYRLSVQRHCDTERLPTLELSFRISCMKRFLRPRFSVQQDICSVCSSSFPAHTRRSNIYVCEYYAWLLCQGNVGVKKVFIPSRIRSTQNTKNTELDVVKLTVWEYADRAMLVDGLTLYDCHLLSKRLNLLAYDESIINRQLPQAPP